MFFHSFKSLRQRMSPSFLGLDIGTTSVKIVEVKGGDAKPRIVNYGILESQGSLARQNTALQTSKLKLFEQEVREFLETLLGKMKPATKQVVASLPLFSAFTTVLKFPDMSPSDLEKAVIFQAKQYIPLSLSEVVLDWHRVGDYEDEKGRKQVYVFLVSVPKEQVSKYQEICKSVGLSLHSVEVESASVARALSVSDAPFCIVDIGSRSTEIAVVENRMLRFASQTDFAGSSLTHALSNSLNINPLRAEELKKERGVMGTGPNRELSTIMLPFLDAIITEIKRVQFNYQGQFPSASPIAQAVLAGGGANLLGIEKYMSEGLGMSVVKANPFGKFDYPPEIEPLVSGLNAPLSVALGLTLRGFEE